MTDADLRPYKGVLLEIEEQLTRAEVLLRDEANRFAQIEARLLTLEVRLLILEKITPSY